MNFNDIFKSSFLENVSSISVLDMLLTIVLSFGIGLFIFLIYKKTYRGVMYSAGFGTTLIALTMITSIVILAVTSNVVLSLGMVGALSIVRFRTAIKDPLDIAFLFWAIGAGIILAAGKLYGQVEIGHVSAAREHQMLKQVSESRSLRRLIFRAYAVDEIHSGQRRRTIPMDNDSQSVIKRFLFIFYHIFNFINRVQFFRYGSSDV